GGWMVTQEGHIGFTCIGVGTDVDPHFHAGTFSVLVDSTPPVINITSPLRGWFIQSGGKSSSTVPVKGTVEDAVSHVVAATLDGETLSPPGTTRSFAIDHNISSKWGLTIITASAEDECQNRAVHAQSFIRSGEFFVPRVYPDEG